jgi:phage terminase large subunit
MQVYQPHAKQVQAHSAFLTGGYKRGVLLMGRQSGKTYFATNHSWLSGVIKQGRYFIVFKTYKQAKEVVWRQYIPLIPKELIYKKNDVDLIVTLNYVHGPVWLPDGTKVDVEHDEDKPRTTIQLLGSDQADSHRGFKGDGIIFDEYADQDPNNWDSVYKHFFTTTDGWAIFMGTPRGYNHFYDLIEYAKVNGKADQIERRNNGETVKDYPWFYIEATWRDSPYVSKEFIEAERAEATKKGTLSTFMQEVELEFRAVQGAVYPMFDRKVHVVKPSEIPQDLTIYAAIDFGWHTTACLLVGIDKDRNWWVYDEIYGREAILADLIPVIKDRLADKRLVLMVGDSANRDAIETMQLTFPIVGISKAGGKSISMGISLINEKLKPRTQLVGKPKPTMFIGSNCKNFIFEMEAYKFPEDKPDRNPSDEPVKENDHGPDAIRYLALHMKFGMINKEQPIKTGLKFNEYGI